MSVLFSLLPLELVGLVADYLSVHDIAACTRVSRGLRRVWAPYLFRDLDLTSESQAGLLDLDSVQRLFVENGQLTRSFVSGHALEHGILLSVARCPRLRCLDLDFQRGFRDSPSSTLELVRSLTMNSPFLDRVTLHGHYDWTVTLSLFSHCRCLSELHLDFAGLTIREEPVMIDEFYVESLSGPARLTNVKQMSFSGLRGSIDRIADVLSASPNLVALTIHVDGGWSLCEKSRTNIMAIVGNLQSLTWKANQAGEWVLDQMLALGGHAKKLTIAVPNVQSLGSLARSGATSESITLDGIFGFFGNDVQSFLERATRLREFCALPPTLLEQGHLRIRSHHFHDGAGLMDDLPWVLDLDGPTQVWGCSLTLTHLEIAVECLYPAFDERDEFSPPSQVEHTVVYQQLGLLVNLQLLRLGQRRAPIPGGVGEGHGGYQTSCLMLSLESGIDLLRDMQAMRTLDVRWTAHRIGAPELEWFSTHWPKLDAVLGLTDLPPGAGQHCIVRADLAADWILAHPRGVGRSHHTA
ncbi:hypothetical protein EMPS_09284 [Entomortierella parvispora]|uniref:F-box domain-containing protein n=1 Tax=Entomortierella parvispora TaxID=205924 RepID=A0A9P3HI02_9FUNG|nr:hypothetical protein EMPS_09284 [Entomortierella parvispora]